MPDTKRAVAIYILAGTNGAGMSSIAGAILSESGAEYYNPDLVAKQIRAKHPALPTPEANSAAWHTGRVLLERAIARRLTFAFETTLGGKTIVALLERAVAAGIQLRMWYVGLENPELHIARVRSRVSRGGHDIPDGKIRERFQSSRFHLIRLMPRLAELFVYDNSKEADPHHGFVPEPRLLLHVRSGKVLHVCNLREVPNWAKPIVVAALK